MDSRIRGMLLLPAAVSLYSQGVPLQILLCETNEVILLTPPSPGLYWRGTTSELAESLREAYERLLALVPPELADLIGPGDSAPADYRARLATGFPVRNVTQASVYGTPVVMESAVREVSREPIPAAFFAVPENYRRVDRPEALLGL